jgi:hypothetical protein
MLVVAGQQLYWLCCSVVFADQLVGNAPVLNPRGDFRPSWMGPATAASLVPGRWTDAVTDHTVVGDRVTLDVGFHCGHGRDYGS